MPKAEATGLAPLRIGTARTLERRCSGVFDFDLDLATSGWWSLGAEALGWVNAKGRRADFARHSFLLLTMPIRKRRACGYDRFRQPSTTAYRRGARSHSGPVAKPGWAGVALC